MTGIEGAGFNHDTTDLELAIAFAPEQSREQAEFVGRSAPSMCGQSTDEGRHYWWRIPVEAQAVRRMECEFCGDVEFD